MRSSREIRSGRPTAGAASAGVRKAGEVMADAVRREAGGDSQKRAQVQEQARLRPQERARPQPQQRSCNRGPVQERNRRRVIFHSDMNAFYASAEQAERPELRGVPLVVGGHEERRHGIVLAKSAQAKAAGIVTGEALWSAREKCPGLVVVPPRYDVYQKYSRLARRIYYQYTDLVEPFGLDEAWLDLTGALALSSRSALDVAREISQRVKDELGCTVSIGVSWNKIFAKFGSDYEKPDAITAVTPENYRGLVWPAPADELLYVGGATRAKLHSSGIDTVGDLACASPELLRRRLGKVGGILRTFARGEDATPVKPYDAARNEVDRTVKSFGNGLTAPHDIACEADVRALIWLLAESVAQRLREARFRARTVSIGVRDAADLSSYGRQVTLPRATNVTGHIARAAWNLLVANEPLDETRPLRGLHVRASGLVPVDAPEQLELPFDARRRVLEDLDEAVDELRRRFGNTCIQRGTELLDESLLELDVKRDNVVHPVGYF